MNRIQSMTLMGIMIVTGMVHADVLVGWDFEQADGNRDHPSYVSGAVSTNSLLAGFAFDGNNGSLDGTWGNSTATPGPSTAGIRDTKFRVADNSNIQDLTVLLQPGGQVTMSSLHFDYTIPFNASPRDFTLSYLSGDLNDPGGVALYSFANSAKVTSMTGVDVDLTAALTNLTLTGAQSATFRFDFTDDSGKTGAAFIDNIAIVGTVDAIPEPATLGLMASFGAAVLFIRLRMRR